MYVCACKEDMYICVSAARGHVLTYDVHVEARMKHKIACVMHVETHMAHRGVCIRHECMCMCHSLSMTRVYPCVLHKRNPILMCMCVHMLWQILILACVASMHVCMRDCTCGVYVHMSHGFTVIMVLIVL